MFGVAIFRCEHDRSFEFVAYFTRMHVHLGVYRLSIPLIYNQSKMAVARKIEPYEAFGVLATRAIPGTVSSHIQQTLLPETALLW